MFNLNLAGYLIHDTFYWKGLSYLRSVSVLIHIKTKLWRITVISAEWFYLNCPSVLIVFGSKDMSLTEGKNTVLENENPGLFWCAILSKTIFWPLQGFIGSQKCEVFSAVTNLFWYYPGVIKQAYEIRRIPPIFIIRAGRDLSLSSVPPLSFYKCGHCSQMTYLG